MAKTQRRPKAQRRPARVSRVRQGVVAAAGAEELAGLAAKCLDNTRRIERLEFDYMTQVRRCAELQAEIDLLKRERVPRPAR